LYSPEKIVGPLKKFIVDANQMFTTNRLHKIANNYIEECEFRGVKQTIHLHPVLRSRRVDL
jgi:hypothetical protein